MLCVLGKVSMATSKHIIYQAFNSNRLDILLQIAEHVSDLSEIDAICLVKLIGAVDEAILVSTVVSNFSDLS